jgi:hypothetical protein
MKQVTPGYISIKVNGNNLQRVSSWMASRRVAHQRVLCQMMYWHKLVLLMMSTCCLKHAEARNKYIEKECVKLVINQNYVEMHGQQNIKLSTNYSQH